MILISVEEASECARDMNVWWTMSFIVALKSLRALSSTSLSKYVELFHEC